MMNLRKKTLALTMAAAMMGGGASMVQAQTAAVNPGSMGQALIYPYLVANAAGWTSFFHLINTSSTYTVAAKFRLRAAKDSQDLYDIIVVLSPNDMWTGVLERDGSTVGFRATDNTCTVPNYGKDVFVPLTVQGSSEVYAEVIMMGVSSSTASTSVAVAAKHNGTTGIPKSCSDVAAAFISDPANTSSALNTGNTEFQTAINTTEFNILTGKYDLVNVGLGQSGAGRATAVQDFGAPTTGARFNNTNMWGQFTGDWDHPTLAEGSGGLDAINAALMKTALINEWVLNPGLGELSSWIVTFPTKRMTVDAITRYNATLATGVAKLPTFGVDAANCVQVNPALFNREENQLGLASPGSPDLCNEVNVINFKNGSIDSSSVLGSDVAVTINTGTQTGVLAGYMKLGIPTNPESAGSILPTFGDDQTTLPAWIATPADGATGILQGRPVVGFNLTARATPADAVVYDHAYLMPTLPAPTAP